MKDYRYFYGYSYREVTSWDCPHCGNFHAGGMDLSVAESRSAHLRECPESPINFSRPEFSEPDLRGLTERGSLWNEIREGMRQLSTEDLKRLAVYVKSMLPVKEGKCWACEGFNFSKCLYCRRGY